MIILIVMHNLFDVYVIPNDSFNIDYIKIYGITLIGKNRLIANKSNTRHKWLRQTK